MNNLYTSLQSVTDSEIVELDSFADRIRQKEGWYRWIVAAGEGESKMHTFLEGYPSRIKFKISLFYCCIFDCF